MTTEEAIKELKRIGHEKCDAQQCIYYGDCKKCDAKEALTMAIEALKKQIDFRVLKNEFCYLCGKYKRSHLGACDGCRWRDK